MTSKYKIIYYNMKGGNDHDRAEFPDYPDNLGIIRTNEWPPEKNRLIEIKDEKNGNLLGTTVNNIWNNTAAIIKLNNSDYTEASFVDYPQYNNGKGYYLLLADYMWSYTDSSGEKSNITENKNDNLTKYNNIEPPKLQDLTPQNKNQHSIKNNNFASLRSQDIPNNLRVSDLTKNQNLSLQEKVDLFKSAEQNNNVLSTKIDSVVPNDHIEVTKNPFYSPLLSKQKKDYFSEKEIDVVLSNTGEAFSSLAPDKIELLNRKLKSFETIDQKDVKLIVNKNIALEHLIKDPEDEINEGDKIQKWIKKVLEPIFNDLQVKIHSGYVYITRKGATISDVITTDLVPSLNFFKWQENKPIDYHTLKYVIFQNSFQKNIETNIVQKREAEDILAQEYVIAIQPSPYYLLWTLKRLIMIWYGDTVFEGQIRKIKVLINEYRADPNQAYNKENGILPQILIYPRYGSNSARIILSKLEYYFSLYIDETSNAGYQDIQWKESHPTYFIKKNAFMYFSNGSIDLKNYIEASFQSNSGFVNDIFTKDYSELVESKKVMSV
jgi:hypothetical protein